MTFALPRFPALNILLRPARPTLAACRACKLPISADHLYCPECMERPVQPFFGPVCIDCGDTLDCICEDSK